MKPLITAMGLLTVFGNRSLAFVRTSRRMLIIRSRSFVDDFTIPTDEPRSREAFAKRPSCSSLVNRRLDRNLFGHTSLARPLNVLGSVNIRLLEHLFHEN